VNGDRRQETGDRRQETGDRRFQVPDLLKYDVILPDGITDIPLAREIAG